MNMNPPVLAGIGSCCEACKAGSSCEKGLGQWEAIVAAVISAAGQFYTSSMNRRTQEQLQQRQQQFELELQERAQAAMLAGGTGIPPAVIYGGAAVVVALAFMVAKK